MHKLCIICIFYGKSSQFFLVILCTDDIKKTVSYNVCPMGFSEHFVACLKARLFVSLLLVFGLPDFGASFTVPMSFNFSNGLVDVHTNYTHTVEYIFDFLFHF